MEKTFIYTLVLVSFLIQGVVEGNIGVNYGTVADNLPPPSQVARFLLDNTIINRVKLYDTNQEILKAFAHMGIEITVAVPNNLIPHLASLKFSQQWVKTNIVPHVPATNIVRILVGNEVISTTDHSIASRLVLALQTLHVALVGEDLDRRIKVSTPHSLGILSSSSPPSSGRFKQENVALIKQLLGFLQATGSPFMINPYPFFGYSGDTLDYAMFRPNSGVFDEMSDHKYTNMLDAQLDATYSAMKQLGFEDVELVIAETGWPSKGDPGQAHVDTESASEFNGKLIKHVMSGLGTPLMPNKTFETYIFALFNENLKPGPTSERNFGLFKPDMTPVYHVDIFRHNGGSTSPTNWNPDRGVPVRSPVPKTNGGKTWCIPKTGASEKILQANIDYVCGLGLDCQPILEGGRCFYPNSVHAHAAYAMNAYYQATGRHEYDCDFRGTGFITPSNPSYGRCKY
ncbi:putative glucan endo-1,3-beta-D-glucosidase [Helianthus annuus]|uniref:glucan endo-1,3-beta-D-glucosidase n=1 Tax=Helianthus annuus TaxID=4232 RepID=A0A9K3NCJ3_HELAN|nr:glucan endo-1,3-beta-glucosidase [Helianthus annuus]KAF5795442.1 putative glucan endo-1,3-beta-D-glucosidase [Helianthus annuus]KAJ0901681.1 putative glucan endo-1,3-beta-D-glucosidase [Helianthus annuus]